MENVTVLWRQIASGQAPGVAVPIACPHSSDGQYLFMSVATAN